MCGILGIIGHYDLEKAKKALLIQQHRGPDHTGIHHDPHCFLGHNRLSIIDLSPNANQPMRSEKHILIFNGEIYNFKELRNELESDYPFESHSDSEVILAAYAKWGESCVNYFNGMFAFAIYTPETQHLFLARDRFGKKPLYWHQDGQRFIFASEIKTILALLDSPPLPDKESFINYLTLLSAITPKTMFEGIYKLPAGTTMRLEKGIHSITPYYDIAHALEKKNKTDVNTALQHIQTLLQQSIQSRMFADVEVASFLSGGVDSSLISALYTRLSGKKIHTFSIGYDAYSKFDETAYARIAAQHIGSEHHEFIVGKRDFAEAFDSMLHHMDEPINDSACIPTFLLSQKVHENGIKAILSGEGSDEIFFGYKKAYEALAQNPQGYLTVGSNYTLDEKHTLLNPHHFSSLHHTLPDNVNSVLDKSDWITQVDIRIWLTEVLMMKMDKMSMAFSLESRAPFLDYHLVDYVLSLPSSIRIFQDPKHLLKKIAQPYLPKSIINRPKKGFSSPFLFWHYESFGDSILQDLQRVNAELGWFQNDYLRFLYDQGKEGLHAQHLWSLILFTRWFGYHYMR